METKYQQIRVKRHYLSQHNYVLEGAKIFNAKSNPFYLKVIGLEPSTVITE